MKSCLCFEVAEEERRVSDGLDDGTSAAASVGEEGMVVRVLRD